MRLAGRAKATVLGCKFSTLDVGSVKGNDGRSVEALSERRN